MKTIVIDDDQLSANVLQEFIAKTEFLEWHQTFLDPIAALSFLSSNTTDLILLDIEMPNMNGMEFMNAMKKGNHKIILVTSHSEYALEAFEHHVVDYLIKPVSYSKFFKAVSAAQELFAHFTETQAGDELVFVKKDNRIIQIRISEILWVEALGDYATLITAKEKFTLHSTLKTIEEKLPAHNYMRVHRSFIVRIDKIEKIEDNTIFCNNKTIPIGKSYREEVFRKLKMF